MSAPVSGPAETPAERPPDAPADGPASGPAREPACAPLLVGLISDTHGLLRPEALRALRGCGLIVHAGDVGQPHVLDGLRELAPVVAVRGNCDRDWARELPLEATPEVGGRLLHVLHDLGRLDFSPEAAGVAVVVSGHSHQPGIRWRGGVLYVNPGSAGPRRFDLPVSVARLVLDGAGSPPRAEIVELDVP